MSPPGWLIWLLFSSLALAQSLDEWLTMSFAPLLDPYSLRRYIPLPQERLVPYALQRFSISAALQRLMQQTPHKITGNADERPLKLDPSILSQVTDDYRLGMVYLWSLGGVPRDLERSYAYFYRSATELSDPDSAFMVGVFESTNHFFTRPYRDAAKAELFYNLAASLDNREALVTLGHRYRYGIDGPVDKEMAASCYSAASHSYVEYIDEGLLDQKSPGTSEYLDSPNSQNLKLRPVNRNTGAFGAEDNTGLFGEHNYRVRTHPAKLQLLPIGDQSTVLKYVRDGFTESFPTVYEAIESFFYKATEEQDPRSMLGLALIYKHMANATGSVDWDAVATFAEGCERQIRTSDQMGISVLYPSCAALIGQAYLWGEGRTQNTKMAKKWFEEASKYTKRFMKEHPDYRLEICSYCSTGLALCELLDARSQQQLHPEDLSATSFNETAFLEKYEDQFLAKSSVIDPNLGLAIAEMHTANGNLDAARRILYYVQQSTSFREPRTMLELAYLEEPFDDRIWDLLNHEMPKRETKTSMMQRPTHLKLDYLVRAFEMGESSLTLVDYASFAYEKGDLDSSVIAYAICAEMGVSQAQINLADLFDVRHSYVGTKWGDRFPLLRALSEWPLPQFMQNVTSTADRRKLAVRYFGRAAFDGSVDALAKLVEYGHYYQLVPPDLVEHYLSLLEKSNFAWGHWWRGTLYYSAREYKRALAKFSKVLVNPDAWMPAKFSQFLTALHLLHGDQSRPSEDTQEYQKLSWSHLFESYRGIIVLENNEMAMNHKHEQRRPRDLMIFMAVIVSVIGIAVYSGFRNRR